MVDRLTVGVIDTRHIKNLVSFDQLQATLTFSVSVDNTIEQHLAGRRHSLPFDILRAACDRNQVLPLLIALHKGTFALYFIDVALLLQLLDRLADRDPADIMRKHQFPFARQRGVCLQLP